MKKVFTLILFFYSLLIFGQNYDLKKLDFPKPDNLKEIIWIQDCPICSPKTLNDTVAIYKVNKNQKVTEIITIGEGKTQGIIEVKYNSDDKITSKKDYGRWLYSYDQKMKEIASWDSSLVVSLEKFYYNTDKIKEHKIFEGSSNLLLVQEIFEYDENGNVLRETIIRNPNPNSVGEFKPNTNDIDSDNPLSSNQEVYQKEYSNDKDTNICLYYKNKELTGKEIITKYSNGKLKTTILYDPDGKQLKKTEYKYDKENRLIGIVKNDEGINGFGESYDMTLGDKFIYSYDTNGFLKSIKTYFNGEIITIKRPIYIN